MCHTDAGDSERVSRLRVREESLLVRNAQSDEKAKKLEYFHVGERAFTVPVTVCSRLTSRRSPGPTASAPTVFRIKAQSAHPRPQAQLDRIVLSSVESLPHQYRRDLITMSPTTAFKLPWRDVVHQWTS